VVKLDTLNHTSKEKLNYYTWLKMPNILDLLRKQIFSPLKWANIIDTISPLFHKFIYFIYYL